MTSYVFAINKSDIDNIFVPSSFQIMEEIEYNTYKREKFSSKILRQKKEKNNKPQLQKSLSLIRSPMGLHCKLWVKILITISFFSKESSQVDK